MTTITLDLYVSDPEAFAKGDYDYCFSTREHTQENIDFVKTCFSDWIWLHTFDVGIHDLSKDRACAIAVRALDEAIKNTRAEKQQRIDDYEARKQELLALPASGGDHA